MQVQMVEDARDQTRRELLEAHRKSREAHEALEAQRKEAVDLRRSLSDEAKEKEALQRSNGELRVAVKRAESERVRWGERGPCCLLLQGRGEWRGGRI